MSCNGCGVNRLSLVSVVVLTGQSNIVGAFVNNFVLVLYIIFLYYISISAIYSYTGEDFLKTFFIYIQLSMQKTQCIWVDQVAES